MKKTILRTCEAGTFASRNKTKIDGIVIHTTATTVKRITKIDDEDNRKYIGNIIKRAYNLPGITKEQYDFLMERNKIGSQFSDALRLCIQAAGLPRSASWHYCVSSKKCLINSTEDIEVVEFVMPELQAHHVGELGKPINKRSIGIENMYPPALPKSKFTENEAILYFENIGWEAPTIMNGPDGAKYWYAPINQDALNALEDLCVELVTKFTDIYWIGSHFQFSKKNRIDPDPPINLKLLREKVSSRTNRKILDKP